MRTAVAIIGAAAALLLGACGGGSDKATAYDSPKAVADALAKAGLACTGYHVEGDAELGVDQQGGCYVDRENTSIFTFKDNAQRDNWEGTARTLGCSAGKSFGITSIAYVRGNRWVVEPQTETVTKMIADKFDGKPVVISCGS